MMARATTIRNLAEVLKVVLKPEQVTNVTGSMTENMNMNMSS